MSVRLLSGRPAVRARPGTPIKIAEHCICYLFYLKNKLKLVFLFNALWGLQIFFPRVFVCQVLVYAIQNIIVFKQMERKYILLCFFNKRKPPAKPMVFSLGNTPLFLIHFVNTKSIAIRFSSELLPINAV